MKALIQLILIICGSFCLVCCSSSSEQNDPTTWTYVFYADADCGSMYEPLEDFAAKMRSAENHNVVVLQDVFQGDAVLYTIDAEHNIIELDNWGERNMGDPQTLYDLLDYSANNYPADKYILAIYDHGMQWQGSCVDDTDADELSLDETQQALTAFGGVEMVLFTAPCFMGCLEAAYEFKDLCEYFVGSQNISGYYLWDDMMDDICETIIADPEVENRYLVEMMVNLAEEMVNNYGIDIYTLSAIESAKLDDLAAALDAVFVAYLTEDTNFLPTWIEFNNEIEAYGLCGAWVYKDVYSWAQFWLDHETNETIKTKLTAVQSALSACVTAHFADAEHPDARGLTMFFPGYYPFGHGYTEVDLDLVADTHIDELHMHFFGYKSDGPSMRDLIKSRDGYK